jgi:hypothetical protein
MWPRSVQYSVGPPVIEALVREVIAPLAPPGIHLACRRAVDRRMVAQALERVALLILCDTAMVIPPPEMRRARAGIACSKGLSRLGA